MDKFEAWVAQSTRQYRRVKGEKLERLLVEAASGGQAALGQLFKQYGVELRAKLSRHGALAAEHADEVVGDVFVRLPKNLADYVDQGRFEQWLYGLAFNRWRTVRRTLSRDRHDGLREGESVAANSLSAPLRIDLELLRQQAEAMLSETEREAWLLAMEGFQRQEIGDLLGISANAAGVRLDRAKKRLKELLSSYI